MTLASDLSLDRHVSSVACFLWLRQLRRVRHSLDNESVKTLVHAFITSHVDYFNSIMASAPKRVIDELQRVLNAAACLISDTGKYRPWTVTVRPTSRGFVLDACVSTECSSSLL